MGGPHGRAAKYCTLGNSRLAGGASAVDVPVLPQSGRPALPPRPAGALKLAGLVQYVPLPVVGGYLCFVGARQPSAAQPSRAPAERSAARLRAASASWAAAGRLPRLRAVNVNPLPGVACPSGMRW